MSIKLITLLAAFISLNAYSYIGPACGISYHSDSYALGLESAFTGKNTRPDLYNEGCYQAGRTHAVKILQDAGQSQFCSKSFRRGQSEGFQYKMNSNPVDRCHTAGHKAGVGLLQVATREGNAELVGTACVNEYLKGRASYFSGVGTSSTLNNKLRNCYQQGFFEAPLIKL